MKKNLINFIVLIVSIVLICLVIESGFVIFYKEPEYRGYLSNDDNRDKYYINGTTGLVYNLIDNSLALNLYKIQGYDYDTRNIYNITDVVIIGDSFTAGAGVRSKNDTYTHQLQERLNKSGYYTIQPYGMGGLDTYQELQIVKEIVKYQNPAFIILQYTSDDGVPPRSPQIIDPENRLYIYPNSKIIQVNDKLVPVFSWFSTQTNAILLKNSAFARFVSHTINEKIMSPRINESASFESIIEMNKLVKGINSSLILIYLPFAYKDYDFCDTDVTRRLSRVCMDQDINYIDMCNYVDIHSIKSEYEPDNDQGHYNKQGYKIVAELLQDVITNITFKRELQEISH